MLKVSENAAAALENFRQSEGIPDSHGVRLTGEEQPGGEIAVRLAFTDTPEEGDQVTEQSGTEVYVGPELAEPLEEAVMDVQASESGLRFVFRPQEPLG